MTGRSEGITATQQARRFIELATALGKAAE
jgi:hypothetical protein